MDINAQLVKQQRTQKNWTQQHLADACGLSLRTIQRVERYGNASNETVAALASVFEIDQAKMIIPETRTEVVEMSPAKPTNPWLERAVLVLASTGFGYFIAVMTLGAS